MEIRASIEKVPEGTLKTHHQNLNSPALGEGIRKEITLQKMGTGIDRNTDGAEQMIATNELIGAGLENTKNPLLQELFYFVQRYNTLRAASRSDLDELASVLTGIVYRAGAYLTSKPPQPGRHKNRLRWDALAHLADQASAEAAALGIKLVRGPSDMRQTHYDGNSSKSVNVWLEVLDSFHRHAYTLSQQFQTWLSDPGAISGKVSFWRFIGDAPNPEVEYLQGLTHLTTFESDGTLMDDSRNPVHTSGFQSVFSGDGWGIFVVSPAGDLYVSNHQAGEFHHSSFLGGGAVLAAGEIVVDRGRIRGLTAKTGHYWTTPELMLNLLQRLHHIPADAVIRPEILDEQKYGTVDYYLCGALRNRTAERALFKEEIEAVIPNWAHGDGFRRSMNRAPRRAGQNQADSGQNSPSDYVNAVKKPGYLNPVG